MQRDPRWEKVYCTAQNESFGSHELFMIRLSVVFEDTVYYVNYAIDPFDLEHVNFNLFKSVMDRLVREMDKDLPSIMLEKS